MPTVVELRKRCKELKLKKYSTLKKAQLEKLLRQNEYNKTSQNQKPILKEKKNTIVKVDANKKNQDKKTKPKKPFSKEIYKKPWIESREVKDSMVIAKLQPNLYLYRGNRKKIELSNIATYFAAWYGTCNFYMGTKKGYLNIYQLKNNNLNLLDISDVRTINTLLRKSFHDKEKYEMIKRIFIASYISVGYAVNGHNFKKGHYFTQFETESQPWQLSRPLRNSAKDIDFEFANYLCEIGFDGYVAEKIMGFHAEVMLCKPEKDVKLLKEIHRTKFKNIDKMTQAVQPYLN